MKTSFELASSANRALLGAISKNMKAIIVYIDDNKVFNLKAYFYNEPSEEEIDDLRDVEVEMSADLHQDDVKEFRDEFIVWDGKDTFNTKKNLVYCRKD